MKVSSQLHRLAALPWGMLSWYLLNRTQPFWTRWTVKKSPNPVWDRSTVRLLSSPSPSHCTGLHYLGYRQRKPRTRWPLN